MHFGVKMVFCKTLKRTIHIFIGIVIGFLLTSEFRSLNYENFKRDIIFQLCSYQNAKQSIGNYFSLWEDSDLKRSFSVVQNLTKLHIDVSGKRNLLLVGVMTAKQFIDTRALIIYQTWAQDLGGHIIFFSSTGSKSDTIPLVALPGVDDSYPPQKKSFLMFKFMHDYFGDKYKFFMRADDDVFVNVHQMKRFLRSLNSSSAIFLGQTGVGNKQEFGQLKLNFNENFCMGGPGVVMSHVTLSHLAQNTEKCLARLYSTHEDVEIGRCVRRYAGTSCTWSYDMQNIFFHNASIQDSLRNHVYPSKELATAITVHPIKDLIAMKHLYLYYKNIEHQQLRHEITKANRIVNHNVNHIHWSSDLLHLLGLEVQSQFDAFLNHTKRYGLQVSLGSVYAPGGTDSLTTWKFFAQKLYSELSTNPKRHIERHILQAFAANMHQIMATINSQSIRKARILDFRSLYYGYVKFDPNIGVQYILDLLMIYRKYHGKRMTLPIRRHAYAIQTFSETQVQEVVEPCGESHISQTMVHVVVPLAGRLVTLQRFINNYAQVRRNDSFVSLSVVLFPQSQSQTSQEDTLDRRTLLDMAHEHQIDLNVIEVNGTFSRGVAFQQSLTLFQNDSLLFFLDVDMHFTSNVLYRVRRNTLINQQVYFPIVFSQYSNQVSEWTRTGEAHPHQDGFDQISGLNGYWRQFGFGIVSLYKRDLLEVGSYDTEIKGWGMEDLSLFDRFVASNVTIFRAIDPDLVHIYHDIHCDPNLAPIQAEMCLGTKLSTLDSTIELATFANANHLLRTHTAVPTHHF